MTDEKNIQSSEKESKFISIATWVQSLAILFQGILLLFLNSFDKIGRLYLFLYIVFFLAFVSMACIYIFLYLRGLRRIRIYRVRYTVITLLFFFLLVYHFYLAKDYFVDIFDGTKIITTAEYNVLRKKQLIIMENGNKICLNIPKDIAEQLNNEISITDNYLFEHTKTITIEYYPNSQVLLDVDIN